MNVDNHTKELYELDETENVNSYLVNRPIMETEVMM